MSSRYGAPRAPHLAQAHPSRRGAAQTTAYACDCSRMMKSIMELRQTEAQGRAGEARERGGVIESNGGVPAARRACGLLQTPQPFDRGAALGGCRGGG